MNLRLSTTLLILSTLLVACAGMPIQSPQAGAVPAKLHVLNWQGYGSDEPWAIEQFEQMYNVEVVHDYFNSEDELLTKLRTSPGAYDVVLPNIAYIPPAIADGLLQPIDVAQLEVWQALPDSFKTLPEIIHEGQVYGVPWAWGATSLVYNTETFPDGIDSLNALWDPQYAGQVGFEDNYEDAIIFAALAAGIEPANQPADLDAIRAKLEALMPNVRALWQSEDEFNRLFSSGEITLGVYWSGSTSRAQTAFGLPIAFVIPEEGAIGWTDAWAIPTGAPNVEMALKWIDYMSSPEFYVRWDTEAGAPVPANPRVVEQMAEDSFTRTVFGDPDISSKLAFITDTPADVRQEWVELWQEVKASMGR
ncbi:MAG: extracellular solute-binding protein [Caldilineaceae bacterium]|nr:extracellular solute-binding protein [Caldilineaceae bacterium]